MTRNSSTQQYEATITLNNPTDLTNGISYSNGKLIAKNSVDSTNFTVQTGLPDKKLSGTIRLNYNTGSANEAAAIPTLKAVYDNGALTVGGLNVGDELNVYNISGGLIYNVRVKTSEVRVNIEPGIYIVTSGKRVVKVLVK